MLEIPGKACGPCFFCCKVLEIEELKKTAGKLCEHCVQTGGCGVYATRPQVCRDYYCQWKEDRGLPATMRPDKVGTLLMDDPDSDEYHAVCDPEKPFSWRTSARIQASGGGGESRPDGCRESRAAVLAHIR